MRLTDYDAQFFGQIAADGRSYRRQGGDIREAQGVLFQCPACAVGLESGEEEGRRFWRGAHYIIVPFRGRGVPDAFMPQMARWDFAGTGLEDLVTRPSILLVGGCAWHGYIGGAGGEQPGALVTC